MKTNAAKTKSVRTNGINPEQMENVNMVSLTKKERTALNVIYRHAGKRFVYETYSKIQPEMARKYLVFVAKNPWVLYFKWDENKKKFVA